ncbi:MAG: adenylate/guanylate cyclase domain-containing protein [Pseudomonadota bacterium]
MIVLRTAWERLERSLTVGASPEDPPQRRRMKTIFTATMAAALLYSMIFFFLPDRSNFEHVVDVAAMLSCIVALAVLHVRKNVAQAFSTLVALLLPALGAYYFLHGNRDGDLLFAILFPVAAITFLGPDRSVRYLIACIGLVVLVVLADEFLPRTTHPWAVTPLNPDGWLFDAPDKYRFRGLELITFLSVAIILYALSHGGASALRDANQRVRVLLLNILPRSIADRLSGDSPAEAEATIVDSYESCSILFADIVGFTPLSRKLTPDELVTLLNSLFSAFDRVAARNGVEKIKTIGDAYMAACGLPEREPDHAARIADTALELMQVVRQFNEGSPHDLDIRIGIHSGPVVAGVIGLNKFAYDLWGETVNTASRMESHGRPGLIQCTADTAALLESTHRCKEAEIVDVKGYGPIRTWHVLGRKA